MYLTGPELKGVVWIRLGELLSSWKPQIPIPYFYFAIWGPHGDENIDFGPLACGTSYTLGLHERFEETHCFHLQDSVPSRCLCVYLLISFLLNRFFLYASFIFITYRPGATGRGHSRQTRLISAQGLPTRLRVFRAAHLTPWIPTCLRNDGLAWAMRL
jgi:hypothetical protein